MTGVQIPNKYGNLCGLDPYECDGFPCVIIFTMAKEQFALVDEMG